MRSRGGVTRLLGGCAAGCSGGPSLQPKALCRCRRLLTGSTPVRQDFLLPCPVYRRGFPLARPLLLVMGGSQGARRERHGASPWCRRLLAAGAGRHLTGSSDPEVGKRFHASGYGGSRPSADGAGRCSRAHDLAISRSGAGSLSELAVCGTPAVLVPFPQAADRPPGRQCPGRCSSPLAGR